jgi:hypothetical protein
VDTDAIIRALSEDARPVRPLAPPAVRALLWFVPALAAVVVVLAIHGIDAAQVGRAFSEPRLLVEELATLVTAVSATIAAFRSTIPGEDRRWFWVPFAGLAAWVAVAGAACVGDYVRIGDAALAIRLDTDCFLPGAIAGSLLTITMLIAIRRGAPMVPRLTLVLAGLAVAATVNLGLLVQHAGDVSIMLLIWHTLYVAGLAAIAGLAAPALLGWRRPIPAARGGTRAPLP